ncbi:amidohydrolase family protein [Pedobacter gandavensis]|uniref:Amidohydrolase family protein n=1 Tax=Pedobacter gandavensis TaxID=2679963 RepID=A0ABR6EXC4_9SPHI|nr:amidohydrolase family protein [Pedobacter gandavensis]MBB2149945.1 amidohydrolase family protein [Pedobacter gandavensis]
MLKIDSHQHFWNYDEVRDSWITDDMDVLRDDFLPQHLKCILEHYGFNGCIVVQSDQSPEENDFQLNHAAAHPFIKGVVGWVDLQVEDIDTQLHKLSKNEKLKGFRHILQGEPDPALMLKPAFLNGISKLSAHGFTYDILIYPHQLKYAEELVSMFPEQQFILNHLAKPNIKDGLIEEWKAQIIALAKHENVACKVSGMVTEADWKKWKVKDFTPYLDVVFEAFGSKRVMYGSDWPVCLLAADYGRVVSLIENYTEKLPKEAQEDFWGNNAKNFYNLK